MKTILILVSIILFFSLSFSSDKADPYYYFSIDPDTLTPAQNHKLLAKAKAKRWDTIAQRSQIQRTSFFDQSEYDVLHYKIEIAIDMEVEQIDSSIVTITAKSLINGLDSLELDFIDSMPDPIYFPTTVYLIIDSVYTETERLGFNHIDDKLVVELDRPYNQGEEFSFSVRYHGSPFEDSAEGLIIRKRSIDSSSPATIPVAFTDCEPYGSRMWWPCKDRPDDKADSVDIFVTVDKQYYCASIGKLKIVKANPNLPDQRTFHYKVRYPIATYLVALSIAEFTIWSDWFYYGENDSMEIINHVYPEQYFEEYEPLEITPYAIEILSGYFGEYPFLNEKYGHKNWMGGGAMEHQTITATLPNEWGYSTPIVVHELGHQWWGDMITCKSFHDIWLNEGFASYSEALYYEAAVGELAYRNYMRNMEYYGNRSVYVYDTTSSGNIFNSVVYDKGAWVLHTLRGYVGDEAFFNLLHEYANSQYKYGSLTTEEFIDFCENSTGVELREFFNDWVYDILYPSYAQIYLAEPDLSDNSYWICYNLWQTQTYGPDVFEMPVDLRLFYDDLVILDTTVFNNARQQAFLFKVPEIPDSIVVDPDNWILSKYFSMPWGYRLLNLPLDTAFQFNVYLDTILCRGGSGYNEFSVTEGSLPSGLVLDSETGIISGGPGEFGDFLFTVFVDDNYSTYADEAEYTITVIEGTGLPGDANKDESVDILDVIFLINYKYKDGTPPIAASLADPNVDCSIDILDIVYLINYKYKGGPEPQLGCASL